jgi:hypothetical protein
MCLATLGTYLPYLPYLRNIHHTPYPCRYSAGTCNLPGALTTSCSGNAGPPFRSTNPLAPLGRLSLLSKAPFVGKGSLPWSEAMPFRKLLGGQPDLLLLSLSSSSTASLPPLPTHHSRVRRLRFPVTLFIILQAQSHQAQHPPLPLQRHSN